MRLLALKVENFRNLSGIELKLHPHFNFLIGENNLGKSNILDLLYRLFGGRAFDESDFADCTKELTVFAKLRLEDFERGIFDEIADPANSSELSLAISQASPDAPLITEHEPTGTILDTRALTRANFFYYTSTIPSEHDIAFDKKKGGSRFLTRLLKIAATNAAVSDQTILNSALADRLVGELRQLTCQIKIFSEFNINPSLLEGDFGILSRILSLKDAHGIPLSNQGHGFLHTAALSLAILERIAFLLEKGANIQTAVDGQSDTKLRSILGLDEPEAHLHPFLQRSLIVYLQNICGGSDAEFASFLKTLLGLDSFQAQVIIATHSPNVFYDNFRHLIRLFRRSDGGLGAVNGFDINVTSDEEKHYNRCFSLIRESFFSRAAVIVEGETEMGAFPLWFRKFALDPDRYGISFINAQGTGGAIRSIVSLLKQFQISAFAVIDRDDGNTAHPPAIGVTTSRDFEEELVSVILANNSASLRKAIGEMGCDNYIAQKSKLDKIAKRYEVAVTFCGDIPLSDLSNLTAEQQRVFYLAFLDAHKGIMMGRVLGDLIAKDEIPLIYSNLITTVKEALRNVRPYF